MIDSLVVDSFILYNICMYCISYKGSTTYWGTTCFPGRKSCGQKYKIFTIILWQILTDAINFESSNWDYGR